MARLASSRWPRIISVGAALCSWSQAAAAAEAGAQGPFDVQVDGGRLSVDLGAVPLADVLRAIAEQTGAELVIRGDLGELTPQTFAGKPLAEGIRQLVGSKGLVMTFEPARQSDGAPRLRSLLVSGVGATPSPADEDAESSGQLPSVWEFGRGGDDAVAAALAQAAAQDPDALVRATAGASVGGSEGLEAEPAVRTALVSDDPLERVRALRAIGARGGEEAVGSLIKALTGDENPEVRRTAVEILADLGSEEARLALEGALDDPDSTVRATAGQVLGRW